jgi:adenosylcobyric acid synthase
MRGSIHWIGKTGIKEKDSRSQGFQGSSENKMLKETKINIKKKRAAVCLAVFGTGSDVGKSVVATALCRYFAKQGLRVAPYKAQNMSNNSGVTPEGLEMGRAQIVQAEAAGIPPHVDMNPILLKPTSDIGSQIVCLGVAMENSTALQYHKKKESLLATATEALDRLRDRYDLIIIEGAGSCAEVNLMAHDIVNFRIAEYADAPVILVGDIHRGGIFAQLVGTINCLPADPVGRIAGFVINRFRGDIRLFKDGVDWIEKKTGKPVLGVLPWYSHFAIEAEDSVVIESPDSVSSRSADGPVIAVIRIPHISNFTDFDPLAGIAGIDLRFVEKVQDLSSFSAVILPGSKNTRFDLRWLIKSGWAYKITDYVQNGGHVLGICGGYQMLGKSVQDEDGLEGKPGITQGLSLLPVTTYLKAPKTTTITGFKWQGAEGRGYEIHMGSTEGTENAPLFHVFERNGAACNALDGCISENGRVMGTYIHGMFDSPGITKEWLGRIGLENISIPEVSGSMARDRDYDLLAEHFEEHIDIQGIRKFMDI